MLEITKQENSIKMTQPLISIIIPSKNGLHHLKDCLPSVKTAMQNSPVLCELVICSDHSTDGTLEFLKENYPDFKAIENPKDAFGACHARNNAVKASSGKYILFLDNDVCLEPDFFIKTVPLLKEDMFCYTCCGHSYSKPEKQLDGLKLLSFSRGTLRFTGNIYNEDLPQKNLIECYGVQGAYFYCTREKFDLLGGISDLYSPYMLEESDFVYRGMKRGWPVYYIRNVKPLHKWGGTIASKTNPLTKFVSIKNRIILNMVNLTDNSLLLQSLILYALRHPIAFFEAVKYLKPILKLRRSEKPHIKVTDKELLKASKETKKRFKSK